MPEFLTTSGISFYVEKIIREAKDELNLLMPYLQLDRPFYEALKVSSENCNSLVIVYASEDLYPEEKNMLAEFNNLEIYNSVNLNARCCCNEENVMITSMDIFRSGDSESIEMGILINKTDDTDLYKKTYNQIKAIVNSSDNMNLHKRPVDEIDRPSVKIKRAYHGFCINCAMPISYNLNKTYCSNCASESNKSSKEGEYCHMCGMKFHVNADSPLCDNCVKVL